MEEAPNTSTATYSLGIDVSKETLELALLDSEEQRLRKSVPNDGEGFEALQEWLQDRDATPDSTRVCMEASGGYEEAIAERLYESGYLVSARVRGGSRPTRTASSNEARPIRLMRL